MKTQYILATSSIAMLLAATPAFADSDRDYRGFLNFDGVAKAHMDGGNDGDHENGGIGAQVRLLAQNASTSGGIGAFVQALAHDRDHDRDDEKKDRDHATTTPQVNISGTITSISGTTLTLSGQNSAVYTVDAGSAAIKGGSFADLKVGDTVTVRGTLSGSIIAATSVVDKTFLQNALARVNSVRAGVVNAINGSVLTIMGNGTTSVTTNSSTTVLKKGGATTTAALSLGSRVLVLGTSSATTSTSTPDTITASIIILFQNGVNFLKHFFVR